MMEETAPPLTEELLDALAVIGRATPDRVARLAGVVPPPGGFRAPSAATAVVVGDEWEITPAEAARRLVALEQRDLAVYRGLHQRAFEALGRDIRVGRASGEELLLPLLWRLAERLLKDDPAALIALVRALERLPLATDPVRHLRDYLIGAALIKEGGYERARDHLARLASTAGLTPEILARTLNAVAVCDRIGGRPEAAQSGYLRSLALWQGLGDRLNEGKVRLNLGINAYDLQQYESAEAHLHAAAARLQEAGSAQWGAAVDNELALLYRDRGEWARARAHLDRFVAQRRREGATDAVGSGLNNIGEVLLLQGHLGEARAHFDAALAAMSTPTYRVDARLNLGLVALAEGRLPEARTHFERALARAESIGRREILPFIHLRLGGVLAAQGETNEARNALLQGALQIEEGRAPMKQESFRISLTGRWQQLYERLILLLIEEGAVETALLWSERARARALTERLVAQSDPADALSSLQSRLPAHSALVAYLTTGVEDQAIPMLRALERSHPLRPHLLTPARTLAFVVTPARLTVTACPLDPNLLATRGPRGARVEAYREQTVLRSLHERLIAPLDLPPDLETLYLAPHGPLHPIPFAALTAQDGSFLLHDGGADLIFVPGASYLAGRLRPARRRPAGRGMVAIGYNGSDIGEPLIHAETEAREVAALMSGEARVGTEAAAAARPGRVAGRRHLHLACHAWFDEAEPLASFLELAPGLRLTAAEILDQWRLDAELVTLSACRTGVSRLLRGDEPMGLIRAFLAAGAGAVLVSGWRVDDLATRRLMVAFYRLLARGESVPTALRHAQLFLRAYEDSTGGQPHADPGDWAAFRIVGLSGGGQADDDLQLRNDGAGHVGEGDDAPGIGFRTPADPGRPQADDHPVQIGPAAAGGLHPDLDQGQIGGIPVDEDRQ